MGKRTGRRKRSEAGGGKKLQDESIDRLSDLPESIIHHIFSYLPIPLSKRYMRRLIPLSKRFTQLCLSSPYLYLGLDDERDLTILQRRAFRDFVDKLIMSTPCPNDLKIIHTLSLSLVFESLEDCLYYDKERCCLGKWARHLAETNNDNKLQVLKLKVVMQDRSHKRKEYPLGETIATLFTLQSLRVLEITWHPAKHYESVQLLPSMILPCLKELTLASINFSGGFSLGDWISSCCPSLNKLTLVSILDLSQKHQRLFQISHPILEDLTITQTWKGDFTDFRIACPSLLKLDLEMHDVGGTVVIIAEIWAPKLQDVNYQGNFVPHINCYHNSPINGGSLIIQPNYTEPSPHKLVEFFKNMASAKVLRLSVTLIEILMVRREEIPIHFLNLTHLEITIHGQTMDHHIPVIAEFILRATPNVESLTIRRVYLSQDWQRQIRLRPIQGRPAQYNNLLLIQKPKLIPQVKEVKLELYADTLFKRRENHHKNTDFELVKYFLEVMVDLTKMTIMCYWSYTSSLCTMSSLLENQPMVVSGNVATALLKFPKKPPLKRFCPFFTEIFDLFM